MIDYIFRLSAQPYWVFIAIILASYVLEDIAIITAAILAADQTISVPLAFSAILIGIISGDIGLYLIGHLLKDHPKFQHWLEQKHRHYHYARAFGNNLIKNIFLIRFIPGLRLVCYTSCGLFKAHFGQFILGISIAGVIWVSIVFSLVYQLGSSVWLEYSAWKWLIIPCALLLLIFSNRKIMQRYQQQENIV